MLKQQLSEYFAAHRQEMIDDISALVRIRSDRQDPLPGKPYGQGPADALDKALEQQVGMIDPRRSVLDMAMDNEIVALHERIRELQQENQRLRAENEKMQKALSRRNDKLLRNL